MSLSNRGSPETGCLLNFWTYGTMLVMSYTVPSAVQACILDMACMSSVVWSPSDQKCCMLSGRTHTSSDVQSENLGTAVLDQTLLSTKVSQANERGSRIHQNLTSTRAFVMLQVVLSTHTIATSRTSMHMLCSPGTHRSRNNVL